MTTGPLLLLEVEGQRPGAILHRTGAPRLKARVRVRSEVAPVTHVDLIVNGQTAVRHYLSAARPGQWIEFEETLPLRGPSWVAARAWSQAGFGAVPTGQDEYSDSAAEAHTNPVYCYVDGRRPCSPIALDAWLSRLDFQIAAQSRRNFPEKAQVLAYYQRAREFLAKIRTAGGLPADAEIRAMAGELPPPTPGSTPSAPAFVPPRRDESSSEKSP
jgi:hypothetical protein